MRKAAKFLLLMDTDFIDMAVESERFSFVMPTKLWGKFQFSLNLLNKNNILIFITIGILIYGFQLSGEVFDRC